jgi:hypothetical protein
LAAPALEAAGLNSEPVRLAWQQHLSRRVNVEGEIWSVLMFQAWMETYRAHGVAAPPAHLLATTSI